MLTLTNEQIIGAAMSYLLPLVISLVLRPTMSDRTRTAVSFTLTLLFVVATQLAFIAVADTPSGWQSWLRYLLSCVVLTGIGYQSAWKPSGLAATIEAASSPPSAAKRDLVTEAKRKTRPPRTPEGA